MELGKWKEILFNTSKITKCASRIGPAAMNSHIILETELAQELSNIVDVYRNLRINNRNQIALCIFLVMASTLSSKLGYSSMLLTLLFVTATLVYLTISQQEMVRTMQRNIFQICYKSLVSSFDNVIPQNEDSGVDEQ